MDSRDFVSFLMVWMYKGIFLKHAYIQIKHTNTASACLTFVTIFWLWLWVSLARELISCQKPPLPEPTKHLRGDPINSQPRPIVSTNTFKANVTIRCRVGDVLENTPPEDRDICRSRDFAPPGPWDYPRAKSGAEDLVKDWWTILRVVATSVPTIKSIHKPSAKRVFGVK